MFCMHIKSGVSELTSMGAITRQTLESSVPLCVAMSTGDEHGLGVTMYVLMMRYTPSQV